MQPEYILGVADFKNLHSYGRMETIGVEVEVLIDGPELRKEAKSSAAFVCEDIIGGLEERISSWLRLKVTSTTKQSLLKMYHLGTG